MLTDQARLWWIVLDSLLPRLAASSNVRGYGVLQEYVCNNSLSLQLAGYQLLRGEMPLDVGSICEELACNIAILAQTDGPGALV